LEAGRIFYGANRNVFGPITDGSEWKQEPPEEVKPVAGDMREAEIDTPAEIVDKSLFLHCMGRVFAIYARQKNLWSMDLTPEQVKSIEAEFDKAGIPYKLQIDDMNECIIDHPTENDPAPANSRVVFEIDGIEYHVLNYNSYLIKRSTAEKISKAFDNHFITSYVELRGKYFNKVYIPETKPVQRPLARTEVLKTTETITEVQQDKTAVKTAINEQVSMFNALSKQVLADLQDTSSEIRKINAPAADQWDYIIPADAVSSHPGQCIVIADDKFCGAYIGNLVSARTRQMNYKFADVRIVKMLRYPRQDAIFNDLATIERDPYPEGSVHSFDLDDIKFLFDAVS
jgi:hypothetical protein